ncbi:hypothetical protein PVAP13_2KG191582 [Panicum virgatum]|uniref:Uncharacterized protein n=1 Tax=Panicum virgatum TaxID=38727 RepID=A0A8T0W2S6_PANVG|nr:hypothetical protein PVAP13_2KG191582 [Panicum virgatum]
MLDDGYGGVVLGSHAMGRLRHPRRSARARHRRMPTPASGAGQRPRTPPPTSPPTPSGRISGRPVRGNEPTPDLGAADLGSRCWALGREGEGEEEAAGRCTGGSPVDLGAAGVGATTHRWISGREVLSAAAEVLAERGRGQRRPPDAGGQGRKLSGRC